MLNKIDLSRIDLNLLVLFEVVYRERHVGRAADRLNVSPSAISHGLARLRYLFNDPLFLRHPKGVVPTERAGVLAVPIGEILGQVRRVVASGERFDPAQSRRRFTIGATDAIAVVILPPLLAAVRRTAPGVDVCVRHVMPATAAAMLDAREVDLALVSLVGEIPARFIARMLYEEDFVAAMRAGHELGPQPSIEAYCAALHVVVSATGEARGGMDTVLEQLGLSRRVALVVPSFMLALAVVAETDLVAAVSRGQARMHGPRFGVVSAELPMRIGRYRVCAVAPKAAMEDGGLAWLISLLETTSRSARQRTAISDGNPP